MNTFPHIKTSAICFFIIIIIYFSISKSIFDHVHSTSKMIVDEEFHLPLGLSYCKFNFFVWDPKVTTLPGLYLISSTILGPFQLCTTYWLRFVSFGASIVNILLFHILYSKYEKNEWMNILSSFTLSLLPPLYFFGNLYYTEIVSLTMILLMFVANEKGFHFFSSIFGFGSVLCRQTNIIWVAFLLGRYILVELYSVVMRRYIPPNAEKGLPLNNMWRFAKQLMRQRTNILHHTTVQFWLNILCYTSVLLSFLVFLRVNGSIVVGDKSAHEATIHFPQLFYFSLFCMIFSWPHFVGEVHNFRNFAESHKLLVTIFVALAMIVVFKNTLVHPYMLADNRHYVFYIWNRFYGKYTCFRYAMVPFYIFSWYVIIKSLYDKNDVTFILLYLPCIMSILVTQKLIDVRYYFVPYILFKFRLKHTSKAVFNLVSEFVSYLLINAITFTLFFNKSIIWQEYHEPQRLIW